MRRRAGYLFPRDPYWLQARFPAVCAGCGAHIAPGANAFYYPNSRTLFCNADGCGQQEARNLAAAMQDEAFARGGYG